MASLSSFVPAIILGAGLGLLGLTHDQERPKPVAPIAGILDTVHGYTHTGVEVDTNSQRVAGMDEYVNRVYSKDSTQVFSLYVGYYTYQTQGKSIHSPRNCLPGAGWEPVLNNENSAFRWVVPAEVESWFMWPGQRACVAEIMRDIIGRSIAEPFLRIE